MVIIMFMNAKHIYCFVYALFFCLGMHGHVTETLSFRKVDITVEFQYRYSMRHFASVIIEGPEPLPRPRSIRAAPVEGV